MRAGILLGLLFFRSAPCDKAAATADADASATAASATAASTAAGASATGTGPAAAGTAAGAAGTAKSATPGKGGAAVGDAGVSIVNNNNGNRVDVDGGKLTLTNDGGSGSIAVTDAGTVFKGQNGKTLTLPPIPGVK